MPSRRPISSFEQPRAISSTTWSCRSVRAKGASSDLLLIRRSYARSERPTIGRKEYSFRSRSDSQPSGGSDPRRAEPAAHEARLVPAEIRLFKLLLRQRTDAKQQLELVPQVRVHHL